MPGEDANRKYQRENEHVVLDTGVAYPLIKRLLSINTDEPVNQPVDQPVEVVLPVP